MKQVDDPIPIRRHGAPPVRDAQDRCQTGTTK